VACRALPHLEPVVERGELKTADEPEIARGLERASERLAGKTQKLRR